MVIDKVIHYMMRAEIYMMGFRRTLIIGVEMALDRRGIKGALTYSKDNVVMILYKDRTVCFGKTPASWLSQDFNFVDYVYEQLDEWNWD